MKFNEFIALDEKLEQGGTSINEVVKEVTGEYLFEAKPDPESLDTGGDKLKRVTSPRFAKARRKITNNAKKFLNVATKNVIEKYLPKQLEQLKTMANKAVGMRADDKNPKEILQTLGREIKKMQQIHDKSTLQLEDAIDKMATNFDTRVKTIIDGSEKLNDKSKLKLDMYWTLVSTQVKQKIFNKILETRNKSMGELIQNNPELAQLMKVIGKLPNTEAKIAELKKKTAEETDKYKKADEKDGDEKDGEEKDGEEKSATSYMEDIEGEKDEKNLTTLYNDLQKAKIADGDKKKLLAKLKEKGIPKEETA